MDNLEEGFKRFEQNIIDYRDLSIYDYLNKNNAVPCTIQNDINNIYKEYWENSEDEDEDKLEKEERIEEVYLQDLNTDELDNALREFNEPLEIQTYKNQDTEEEIHEITITCGGPNIYLTINTRWSSVTYEAHWGGNKIEEDLSYLYKTVMEMYNLY